MSFYCSIGVGVIYPNARLRARLNDPLVQELIDWKPDVVHSQCEFSTFSFAKRIAHESGCPLIHTYHTVYRGLYALLLSQCPGWGIFWRESFRTTSQVRPTP